MLIKTKTTSPSMAGLCHGSGKLPVEKMLDHNNNNSISHTESLQESHNAHRSKAAISFKYRSNARQEDINNFRRFLANVRVEQLSVIDAEEYKFYESDFMRMMVDDWLVTRFLLRGKKAAERQTESGEEGYSMKLLEALHSECSTTRSQLDDQAIMHHTMELVKACAKYRFDYQINGCTSLHEFPHEWVKTGGLFNYKQDAMGNPTIYLRVAMHKPKLIETPEARHLFKRYLLYNMERCDQDLCNKPGKAICCVFDLTNVAFENIDLELTTWMIKSFKSSSPKLICYVLIYNPPWFFSATFKVICNTLLSSSKRQSVKFASGNEILDYIERDNLPPYLQSVIH